MNENNAKPKPPENRARPEMLEKPTVILGGGLVGLALAAALDSSGLSSIVIDPANPAGWLTQAFDGRTSAVSSSSKRMFDTVGISDHFPEAGCPIRRIEVADGLEPGGLSIRARMRSLLAGCTRTGICAPPCWRVPKPGSISG